MLEIPESKTISLQTGNILKGKRVTGVKNATSPHKFAWYAGDPAKYNEILTGKQVKTTNGHGMFVDIHYDENTHITISDGTNMRYYSPSEQQPEKYQLLVEFDNGCCIAFTVAMYGGIFVYRGTLDNSYYQRSLDSISPLDDAFDELHFDHIFKSIKNDLSIKALLATEQRIPGLGNGVLQDILFNAHIHPKRKKSTLSDSETAKLFLSLKETLKDMKDQGGRDTEKDFFGKNGGYKTILSKNTVKTPCSVCGDTIVKQAYLGGTIYFCPTCQKS